MMRETREKDTKTLRYDWFLSDDGTECEVREGYVDADALIEHAHNVAEAKTKLFREVRLRPRNDALRRAVAGTRRADGGGWRVSFRLNPVLLVAGTGRRHRGS